MTKRMLIYTAALGLTAAGLQAQTGGTVRPSGFQEAGQLGQPAGTYTTSVMPAMVARAVTGKPFSGTEERKTVQTLGDGTVIENSDSNLLYRDAQGRTRTERTIQGKTTIRIVDPVEHFTVDLDPVAKTARKMAMPAGVARGGGGMGGAVGGGGGGFGGGGMRSGTPAPATTAPTERGTVTAVREAGTTAVRLAAISEQRPTIEQLGVQAFNGVTAEGTRNTQVIPAGKIGNSRDLHVVNERWFSPDLQMVVRTVNTDPRFGTTTYQLTNIVQGPPDASLFQIPADYAVTESGR